MSASRYVFSVKPQEALLILITMFWGGTFLAVQYAVTLSDPFFFVGLRFATAAIAVALISLKSLRGLTLKELKAGVAIGVAIAMGYSLQTWGLQSISSSKSAFITAMYVPLVPLLQWLCLGRIPGIMSCVGIVLAFIGLILLAGPGDNLLALGPGEIITLVGAIAIAAEIILISAWAGQVDVKRVTVVQLATASLVAFGAMVPAGEAVPALSPGLIVVALGLGIFSAIIQVTMNWAQKSVSPTRATVIYTGEPVWAGIFGRIAGERLPVLALLGGVFIVVGVLVSELKLKKKRKAASANLRLNRGEQKCPSLEGHWLLTVLPDNLPLGDGCRPSA
nr:DMT family transporter [Leclercia sp. UBA1284]